MNVRVLDIFKVNPLKIIILIKPDYKNRTYYCQRSGLKTINLTIINIGYQQIR